MAAVVEWYLGHSASTLSVAYNRCARGEGEDDVGYVCDLGGGWSCGGEEMQYGRCRQGSSKALPKSLVQRMALAPLDRRRDGAG